MSTNNPKTPPPKSKKKQPSKQPSITNYFMVLSRTRDENGLLNNKFEAKIGSCEGDTPTKLTQIS